MLVQISLDAGYKLYKPIKNFENKQSIADTIYIPPYAIITSFLVFFLACFNLPAPTHLPTMVVIPKPTALPCAYWKEVKVFATAFAAILAVPKPETKLDNITLPI